MCLYYLDSTDKSEDDDLDIKTIIILIVVVAIILIFIAIVLPAIILVRKVRKLDNKTPTEMEAPKEKKK